MPLKVRDAKALHHALSTPTTPQIILDEGDYEGTFEIAHNHHIAGPESGVARILGGFHIPEGSSAILEMLTIEHAETGYPLKIKGGPVILRDVVARGHKGFETISVERGSVHLIRCRVEGGDKCLSIESGAEGIAEDCTIEGGHPSAYALGTGSKLSVFRCKIAGGGGAAIFANQGGELIAEDCQLDGGGPRESVAIAQHQSRMTLLRCVLQGGSAPGLMSYAEAHAHAIECIIEDNDKDRITGGNDAWCWGEGMMTLERCKLGETSLGALSGTLTPKRATALLKKAMIHGSAGVMRIALAAGADGSVLVRGKRSVLIALLDQSFHDIDLYWIQKALASGADPNALDNKGRSAAFFMVSRQGPPLLAAAGMRLDVVAKDGSTPLHSVARLPTGHYPMEWLLERGADPSARDNKGLTPLHWAAEGGNEFCVDMLLDAGAELEAKDKRGMTPFDLSKLGARKVLRRRVKTAEKRRAKAASTPKQDLASLLAQMPRTDDLDIDWEGKSLPKALSPWWDAVRGAAHLGGPRDPLRLWGGLEVLNTPSPFPDWPLRPIGDDGLGRWLFVATKAIRGRTIPSIVMHPADLGTAIDGLGGVDLKALLAIVGPLDLADWLGINVHKKPGPFVHKALSRDKAASGQALRRGALAPLLHWHPHKSRKIDTYTHDRLCELRRALRLSPQPLPSGGVLRWKALCKRFGFKGPKEMDPVFREFLSATRALEKMPGPFGLLCAGSTEAMAEDFGYLHMGTEAFGHEVWVNPEYGGAVAEHRDVLVDGGGMMAIAENRMLMFEELVALDIALAPFVGELGISGEPEDLLEAVSAALGKSVRRTREALSWSSDLGFLKAHVTDVL